MLVVHLGRVELGHEANSSLGAKWPRNITYSTSRSAVDRPLLAPVALLAISVYDIRERERQFPPQPPAKLLSLPPSAPFPSLRNVPPQVIRCPLFPRYISMYFQ